MGRHAETSEGSHFFLPIPQQGFNALRIANTAGQLGSTLFCCTWKKPPFDWGSPVTLRIPQHTLENILLELPLGLKFQAVRPVLSVPPPDLDLLALQVAAPSTDLRAWSILDSLTSHRLALR